MNKKFTILIVAVALCLSALAQNEGQTQDFRRHEISLGYGFQPVSSESFLPKAVYFPYWIDKVGAISGAYTYFFNPHFGVGGTYSFDPREIDYRYNGPLTNNPLVADLYESCHSVMGHVKFNCVNKKHFILYIKADAGVCFWGYRLKEYQPELFGVNLPKQHCCFAWQTAAGIEVGNDRIAGFAQCGVGMEGNFGIGIRYKFNTKAQ